MDNKISLGKITGKFFVLLFSSLFASLILGSMTTLAASGSSLNVMAHSLANNDLPVTVGGTVTYFYQIWNTGADPVSNLNITDDKCSQVTYDAVNQDINGDHKLDKGELWSYYCTIIATTTTTNTITITGQVNGAPVSASTTTTLVVPAAGSGSGGSGSGSGAGSGGPGSAGGSASGGTAVGGVPKGMPNTGLGGKAHKKNISLKSRQVNAYKKASGSANTLVIPTTGTDAKIEAVGLTANGNMNVPDNAREVGWYQFGTKPGETGNTVIDGHLDTYTSSSGVFGNLDKLKTGDDVYVVNAQNEKIHYKVNHTDVYKVDDAPLQAIFGSSDKAHLNLITCTGAWDKKLHQYTQRRVVYTDLVQ